VVVVLLVVVVEVLVVEVVVDVLHPSAIDNTINLVLSYSISSSHTQISCVCPAAILTLLN
jgi:hypothetical protein